jgi:hypothetical protein
MDVARVGHCDRDGLDLGEGKQEGGFSQKPEEKIQ